MGKKSLERQLADNEAKAVIRRLRVSPRKLGLVAGLIRGMKVGQALTQLSFSEKRIANDVKKALQSAIANAENNHNLNVDELVIKEAYVGKNLVMKRFHTRGRGKSAAIKKPFSNLTLIVREQAEEMAPEAKKPEKKAAKKKPAAKKETN
ncbi:MAG: 50S ribosomal protein L22 [Alphaproteobacteria bacterium]|nr:50S ribosomal protein L22 [Alphaproteobacteria bacterium]